jgi:hypothetical protein
MSAILHRLPMQRPTLAVRRYHALVISQDGARIELDIDAVDYQDADDKLLDKLVELGIGIPFRASITAVTGAAVGEQIETEPTGHAELDNPAVPGPVRQIDAARQARKSARTGRAMNRPLMRRTWAAAAVFGVMFWAGLAGLAKLLGGAA